MHARTSTCPLRQRGPPSSLHSHPRVPVAALVLQAALAEPSSQLVITTLPPSSPSCAPRLCSFYHLQQLAGAGGASGYPHNWRPKDPEDTQSRKAKKKKKKSSGHSSMGTRACVVTVATALEMLQQAEGRDSVAHCAFGCNEQAGSEWRNIAGRKYADVKRLSRRSWGWRVRSTSAIWSSGRGRGKKKKGKAINFGVKPFPV